MIEANESEVVLERSLATFKELKKGDIVRITQRGNPDYMFLGQVASKKRAINAVKFNFVILIKKESMLFQNSYVWLDVAGFDTIYHLELISEEEYLTIRANLFESLK